MHLTRKRLLVLVVSMLFVCTALDAKSPRNEEWIRVEADGVLVFSNAKESRAIEVTHKLAQFRSVLGRLVGPSEQTLPEARVFLLKNRGSYDQYGRHGSERAYYAKTPFDRFIVLNATPAASTRARAITMQLNTYTFHPNVDMFHEFTHYLLDRDQAHGPLWLVEGLAEYYSTFETKDGEAIIGFPSAGRVAALQLDEWLAAEILFEGSRDVSSNPYFANTFYGQSWAVVHYLISGTPTMQRQLNAYASAVGKGLPHRVAFTDNFAIDATELVDATYQYIETGELPYLKLELTDTERSIETRVTPLTPVETLGLVGRLMVISSGDRADEAERLFRDALAIDPDDWQAHLGLALVAEAREDPERATESYRTAVQQSSGNLELLLRFGFSIMNLVVVEGDTERSEALIGEAREVFRGAIELDPSSATAHLGLGSTYVDDESIAQEAYTALGRARELRPVDGRIPLLLTVVHLRNDDDQVESILLGTLRSYPFPFFDALMSEMRQTATLVATGQESLHAELDEIVARLVLMAAQDPPPPLPKGLVWDALEPELEAAKLHTRLFELACAIHEGDSEKSANLIESIAEEGEGTEIASFARTLPELLKDSPQKVDDTPPASH